MPKMKVAPVPPRPHRPDFDVLLRPWREPADGDGHDAQRRLLLDIVLDLLARSMRRPPDLDAVFAALAGARAAARRDALARAKRRGTQDHARERDRLVASLRRAWDDYRVWRTTWDVEDLWPPDHVGHRGDALLADLEAVDPALRAGA